MRPSVDVITLSYNQRPDLLDRSVSSSLAAGATRVILVDDGSDEPIANAWGERVLLLRHPENRGVPAAFNTALVHIEADYVCRFMSDDEMWGGKIQVQLAAMEGNGWAASFHGYLEQRVDSDASEIVLPELDPGIDRRAWRKSLCADNRLYGCTTMLRREVLEAYRAEGGHPEHLKHAHDWYLHLWVETYCGWNAIPTVLCTRNVTPWGLGQTADSAQLGREQAWVSKRFRNAWRAAA